MLVRFLRNSVKCCLDVGFETKANSKVFGDRPEDVMDTQLQEDLVSLRAYGSKDSEVVCLTNPEAKAVEFWHNVHGVWYPAKQWPGSRVVSH